MERFDLDLRLFDRTKEYQSDYPSQTPGIGKRTYEEAFKPAEPQQPKLPEVKD